MKDRVVQFPHRYQLVPVAGETNVYDFVPVTGTVTEVGTPINKANLLKDETAALYDLTGEDATVDKALNQIQNVGTIKTFPKPITNPKWVLCNGQSLSKATYADLYSIVGDSYWTPVDWVSGTLAQTTNGMAYGNGLWVAVGTGGKIATSTDGVTWTPRTSGTTQYLQEVAYGNGLWVVVGGAGTLLTSTDGVTWTSRTSGFGSTTIQDVAYGNGLWVAVGLSGTLTTSPDGITWTSRTSGFGSTTINCVAYGNGLWIAGGQSGKVSTSTDGVTWTSSTAPLVVSIYRLNYADGKFLCGHASGIFMTKDGHSWQHVAMFGAVNMDTNIVYCDGMWLFALGTSIYASLDIINWYAVGFADVRQLWYANNMLLGALTANTWKAVKPSTTFQVPNYIGYFPNTYIRGKV